MTIKLEMSKTTLSCRQCTIHVEPEGQSITFIDMCLQRITNEDMAQAVWFSTAPAELLKI